MNTHTYKYRSFFDAKEFDTIGKKRKQPRFCIPEPWLRSCQRSLISLIFKNWFACWMHESIFGSSSFSDFTSNFCSGSFFSCLPAHPLYMVFCASKHIRAFTNIPLHQRYKNSSLKHHTLLSANAHPIDTNSKFWPLPAPLQALRTCGLCSDPAVFPRVYSRRRFRPQCPPRISTQPSRNTRATPLNARIQQVLSR